MQFCSQGPSCIAKFQIHNCHSGQSWISSGVWHLQFDSDKRILSSNFVLKTWFEGLIMSLFVQTEDMTDDKSLVCIFLHCLAWSSLMTNEDATLYTVHHFQNKWSVTRKGKKTGLRSQVPVMYNFYCATQKWPYLTQMQVQSFTSPGRE